MKFLLPPYTQFFNNLPNIKRKDFKMIAIIISMVLILVVVGIDQASKYAIVAL